MCACYPDIFIDHKSDLSSAKESVISLSLLLFHVNPFSESEVRIVDDLLR